MSSPPSAFSLRPVQELPRSLPVSAILCEGDRERWRQYACAAATNAHSLFGIRHFPDVEGVGEIVRFADAMVAAEDARFGASPSVVKP